jgi:hypothetical protein
MDKKGIIVVLTNFNNSNLSLNYYESINKLVQSNSFFISYFIIVDNNSIQEEKDILANYKNSNETILKVLYNPDNIGYFNGLNIGLKYITDNCISYAAIIVGNNDLMFSEDFLVSFEKNYNIIKDFPVICPNLYDLEGIKQNPHLLKPISNVRKLIHYLYYKSYPFALFVILFVSITKSKRKINQLSPNGYIHAGYGACYILTPIFFTYYSELFSPFFLMYEESAMTLQLNYIGHKPFYMEQLKILHLEHSTFKKMSNRFAWECGSKSYKVNLKLNTYFKTFLNESRKH